MKSSAVTGRLRGWSDALRTRLWPIPVLMLVAAVALGVLLPRLDRTLATSAGGTETALQLFGGGADAARTVLSAIAGSLVTATSLTFSLTVVTLQLASSQYSPRLLRTFTRDGVIQTTLGLFLATFTYALVVLRVVRSDDTDAAVDDVFVPRLSVTVAVVLTLASVLGLVLFLAHLVREIRVETVLARVHAEARDVVRRTYEPLADRGAGDDEGRDLADDHDAADDADAAGTDRVRLVRAASTGFVTALDHADLVAAGVRCGGTAEIDVRIGDFVVAGAPVARVTTGRDVTGSPHATFAAEVSGALTIQDERTTVQDPAFGLRQIVDVAVKALSPGVNDPTTAVHALGWTTALLVELAGRDCGPQRLRDEEGTVRAVVARPPFAELVALGLEQPLHYGVGDPQVAERLATLLDEVARVATTPQHRITVRAWLGRLRESVDGAGLSDEARRRIGRTADRAEERLRGVPAGADTTGDDAAQGSAPRVTSI